MEDQEKLALQAQHALPRQELIYRMLGIIIMQKLPTLLELLESQALGQKALLLENAAHQIIG